MEYVRNLKDYLSLMARGAILFFLLWIIGQSQPTRAQQTPICGNNLTEPGEACDGTDLNAFTCSSVAAGFVSGTLSCKADCSGYDISQCIDGGHINAASCSQADVQAAIDAAKEGDTVHVPAGTCTWSTPVTIGEVIAWTPPTFESKNLIIQGAGIDQTIIMDQTGAGYNERPFWAQCQEGKPFRITGFTFTGMKKRSSTEPAIQIRGYCSNWRIDHSKFDLSQAEMGTQGRGILTSGLNYGLIDHNIFLNALQGVAVGHDGDASWQQPLSLGTGDAVYIEDNLFDYGEDFHGDGANDAYNGARYVMRYNSITNARIGHHGFDSGGYRSPHSLQIYSNTITFTDPQSWYPMRFRGGTGVVFNNTWIGDYNPNLVIGVVNYRTCCCNWCTNVEPDAYGYPCDPYCACASPLHTSCLHFGRCDGNNPLDGNLDPSGYPCKDQVGRSTDTDGDGIQDQEPLYEWNNTVQSQDADVSVNDPWSCTSPAMDDHLKEGRDFINDTPRPDYVP